MTILENIAFFLEFLFEGYCGYIYFSSLLPKKQKASIIFPLYGALSTILFFVYTFNSTVMFVNIFLHLALFFAVAKICYSAKYSLCCLHSFIFTGLFAVCEYISLPIVNIVMKDNYMVTHTFQTQLLLSTISKVLLFIFCKIIGRFSEKEKMKTKSIWLFILPLASLIIVEGIYYLATTNDNLQISNFVVALCSLSLLASNIIVFLVHENSVRISKQNMQLKLSEQKSQCDYEYYRILQENYDNSRIVAHDTKHHIDVIRNMAMNDKNDDIVKYADSILRQKYFAVGKVITKNKILDVMVMQMYEKCQNSGISFMFKHNNNNLSFIDDADLCCIVSNLLENAYEAADKSAEKTVQFEIYTGTNSNVYFLEINNSCDKAPVIENNKFITTKKNSDKHGIGMYSVKKASLKYHGNMNYEYFEDQHKFRITLMLNNINK